MVRTQVPPSSRLSRTSGRADLVAMEARRAGQYVRARTRALFALLSGHGGSLGGEEAVGRLLAQLREDGFHSIHDIDTGHGNIDHVVVGPTGVFVIETKTWNGRFYWKRDTLWHNGCRRTDVVKQVTRGAMHVKERLSRAGIDAWVEATVVSTRAAVLGTVAGRRQVTVLEATRLLEFLTGGRRRWDDGMIRRMVRAI
jgi:hypothetical protein